MVAYDVTLLHWKNGDDYRQNVCLNLKGTNRSGLRFKFISHCIIMVMIILCELDEHSK